MKGPTEGERRSMRDFFPEGCLFRPEKRGKVPAGSYAVFATAVLREATNRAVCDACSLKDECEVRVKK